MKLERLPRWLEEILPFVAYIHAKWKIDREIDGVIKDSAVSPQIENAWNRYRVLDLKELDSCLKAEHERIDALIEKTFKFGAGLATALTIISVSTALIGERLSGACWKVSVLAAVGPAFVYIAAGGILGLSAIRVQRRFGWGAAALAERKGKSDEERVTFAARDLALQERASNINVMRNEAAFMSLRNGFLLIVLALSLALVGITLGG